MNGNNLMIDTNIALYLLSGDETIAKLLQNRSIYISFITELELLGFKGIEEKQLKLINEFIENCTVIDLNDKIKKHTIELKRKYRLKLPDAIIAATSISMNLHFISADQDFEKISELYFIKYEV